MQVIGLSDDEQNEILRMLAIILWLGNVQFAENDSGNSEIADTGITDFVAYLMDVDGAIVQKALTQKVMETQRGGRRGSVYDVPLNPAQASSGRDALAKAIYNNLFEWIVSRINISMKARGATAQVIGILVSLSFVTQAIHYLILFSRIFLGSRSSKTTRLSSCVSTMSTRNFNKFSLS
jgi:myosin I